MSSIEYSENVAMNELQPGSSLPKKKFSTSTKQLLDVKLLQTILDDTKHIRNQNQRKQQQTLRP